MFTFSRVDMRAVVFMGPLSGTSGQDDGTNKYASSSSVIIDTFEHTRDGGDRVQIGKYYFKTVAYAGVTSYRLTVSEASLAHWKF